MEKIKAFLVDDEIGALKALKAIIQSDAPEWEIVGTAKTTKAAYSRMMSVKPHLLFLDIQIKEATGFELLQCEFDFDFEVIFVTAYDQYAIQAFQNNALSYLLKPVSFEAFHKAKQRVEKVIQSSNPEQSSVLKARNIFKDRVAIPNGSTIDYLKPEEIVFVQADGSYCEIHLKNGRKMTVAKPLKFLVERIRSDQFLRAHRSYLVNTAFIRKWDKSNGGSVILTNNAVLPLSQEGRRILALAQQHQL